MRYILKNLSIFWVLGMRRSQDQVNIQNGRENHKFEFGLWLRSL